MPEPTNTVAEIAGATDWNARVNLIRQIPEEYGKAQHASIYATVGVQVYASSFAPDFAYIPWRSEYEEARFYGAYASAVELTHGFTQVSEADLVATMTRDPSTLLVFRTIMGYLRDEFAVATEGVAGGPEKLPVLSKSAVESLEQGKKPRRAAVITSCARLIDGLMQGTIYPTAAGIARRKQDKPDTRGGWADVQELADRGVPYEVFLHQRHYGGAFGQLLNATSTQRGNLLEDAVEEALLARGTPYIRTGAHNQAAIAQKFNLTVRPAPDFVFFDEHQALRGMLECKVANNGGTARDKAPRFALLGREANRLGGIPLFAVLGGLGWKRAGDALGPVVRDTDGRVFTIATLAAMTTVQPFPQLESLAGDRRSWGNLDTMTEQASTDAARRLDQEERREGHEPW